MMRPKKTKFKKYHKIHIRNTYKKKSHLIYGKFGLVSCEGGIISDSQIQACIMCIKRKLRRKGNLYVRVFPHIGVTKKPLEVRMGKGKGSVDHFATSIKSGSILFELDIQSESIARTALRIAGSKLPFKSKILIG